MSSLLGYFFSSVSEVSRIEGAEPAISYRIARALESLGEDDDLIEITLHAPQRYGARKIGETVPESYIARFQTPSNGGRSTDPAWDERRLVPLASSTLDRLERLAEAVARAHGHEVSAMQVAAILLEIAASEARVEGALKELSTLKKHAGTTLGSLFESLGEAKAVERLARKKRGARRKAKKRPARESAAPRARRADFRRRK